jgi:hypothetical protein
MPEVRYIPVSARRPHARRLGWALTMMRVWCWLKLGFRPPADLPQE